MANWIKCTERAGDKSWFNFDHAVQVTRQGTETRIVLIGIEEPAMVRETPAELQNLGWTAKRPWGVSV
jgi:hypothetical protein